jgi:hypothetical protein
MLILARTLEKNVAGSPATLPSSFVIKEKLASFILRADTALSNLSIKLPRIYEL